MIIIKLTKDKLGSESYVNGMKFKRRDIFGHAKFFLYVNSTVYIFNSQVIK